jgi:hypothetical protein
MTTTAILPQAAQAQAQSLNHQLAAALNISEGRVLRVMASPWSEGRVSYRIAVERDGQLTAVHRIYQERQTVTINDLLWSLADARWTFRPAYYGAGFVAYHPDYKAHLRREKL